MSQYDKIFNYCERGQDPSFWAEPANAVTNGLFVLAGLVAIAVAVRQPRGQRSIDHYLLALLMISIGVGSFLFHTFAERWSATADVAPIGVFMLVYFMIAMVTLVRVPPGVALLLTAAFAASLWAAGQLRCDASGWPVVFGSNGRRCFNGSIGYLPALIAIWGVGLILLVKRHRAAVSILLAGIVFGASLTARTLDLELCNQTVVMGYKLGTHWVWHVLNATTLFIPTRAAIYYGQSAGGLAEIIPPRR